MCLKCLVIFDGHSVVQMKKKIWKVMFMVYYYYCFFSEYT